MFTSSEFFVFWFLAFVLISDRVLASLTRVKDNSHLQFTVFIGTKLMQHNDAGSEIVREVVGIGAIIGKKQVLTTEDYMRWHKQPNIEYFVHVGSHDFDHGGQDVAIEEMKKPPQNVKAGSHTFVLLVFALDITSTFGTVRIYLDDQFLNSGSKIDMIGIYQRDEVRFAVSNEIIMANVNCSELLQVDTRSDKKFKNFGSHMCLVSKNWARVDCKSHIGTIVVLRVSEGSFLSGIKSELHQSCSRVPYIIQFQRITPVIRWLKDNISL